MMPSEDPFGLRAAARAVEGGPRPSAVEIRQRGARRRRHRITAILAGGLAGAVAASAIAIGASGQLGSLSLLPDPSPTPTRMVPDPGGSPSAAGPTSTVGSAQPTWQNVPTTEQIWWQTPGDADAAGDETGWSQQWAPSRCIVGHPDELGARTVLVRSFTGPGAGSPDAASAGETVIVMGFDDAEGARQAMASVAGWYTSCGDRLAADGARNTWSSEPVDLPGSDQLPAGTRASFHQVRWSDPEQAADELGNFEDAVLVQRGNRLAWVIATQRDVNENNCVPAASGDAPQCAVARQAPGVARVLG